LYVGFGPADIDAQQLAVDELRSAAQSAHRPDWEAVAWAFQTDCHLMLGDDESARTAHEHLRHVALVSRDPFAALTANMVSGRRASLDGDFATTEGLVGEQFALSARIGMAQSAMHVNATVLLLPLWNFQQRFDQIERVLRSMVAEGDYRQAKLLWTASLRSRQGRLEEAAAELGIGMPVIDHGHYWGWSVDEATTAIVHLDDPARAEALLRQLHPYRHLDCIFDWLQHRGAVIHHIGRLLIVCGRFTEAVDALDEAVDRYERLHSPPWLVVARRDLARALRGRAHPNDDVHAARFEAWSRLRPPVWGSQPLDASGGAVRATRQFVCRWWPGNVRVDAPCRRRTASN
jgi:tetratricopeptide (TPR) repeat protein